MAVPGDPRIRASDADRTRVASMLREHHAEGRLTAEEFHDRMDKALDATTIGELDELMADLPSIDLYKLPAAGLRVADSGVSRMLLPADRAGPGTGPLESLSAGETAVAAWVTVAGILVSVGIVTAVALTLAPWWALLLIPLLGIPWIRFLIRRSRR
jgi:Domain of unknown function (DUF1707)